MGKQPMTNTANVPHLMLVNSIGMTVLQETLKDCAYMFTHTSMSANKAEQCSDSLAFIQGTGLDIMLQYYYIPLDPDELRTNIFSRFDRKDLIE